MITHHAEKLRVLRAFGSGYRIFVYRVYTYLRDASDNEEFRHSAMMDGVFERFQNLRTEFEAQSDEGAPAKKSTVTPSPVHRADGDARCGHCHRTNVHDHGVRNCPAGSVSAKLARQILKNVTSKTATYTKLCQACADVKSRITLAPEGDVDAFIKEARKEHLGLD